MFVIEKNVPMPSQTVRARYPFGEMEIGDSFLVSDGTKQSRVSSAAIAYGKYQNKKFSTRRQRDGSIRIWRIA